MFSHIMIGSNDIARSKKFYDALFAAMGAQPGVEDASVPEIALLSGWTAASACLAALILRRMSSPLAFHT